MILIEDVLISDDVVNRKFVCNLEKCKGACCWEGDFGAPLDDDEKTILSDIYETVKPYMNDEGIASIEKKGLYEFFEEPQEYGTTLNDDGSCAYLFKDPTNNISYCSIEKAHKEGKIDYYKPISCHLYPIRVAKMGDTMEALNYDEWDICSAACTLGEKLQVPVFEFAKTALIRKYGADFYEQLEGAAEVHLKSE